MTINWQIRSYTKEEFIEAWNNSVTLAGVLRKLELQRSSHSYKILNITADELNLNKEHFVRKGVPLKLFTLEEILVTNSPYLGGASEIRKRLVKAGLKEDKCEGCGLVEWQGKPIPLSLDHINGDNKDNRLENLRVLCLNCHGQTDTWCGKNKIRKTSKGTYPGEDLTEYFCECGTKIQKNNKTCRACYDMQDNETQEYPPTEEMITGVELYGYLKYAKIINLSDNGLRAVLRRRNVDPLPKKKIN